MNFYKIIFCLILVCILFKFYKLFFDQELFSIPKVKVHQVKSLQKKKKEFDPEKTLELGQGRHDRIRYDGKWN